LIVELYKLQSR